MSFILALISVVAGLFANGAVAVGEERGSSAFKGIGFFLMLVALGVAYAAGRWA